MNQSIKKLIISCLVTGLLGMLLSIFTIPVLATDRNVNGFISPISLPDDKSIAIPDRETLMKIGSHPNYPLNGKYHLSGNINLSNMEWVPIGNNSTNSNASRFTGIFDG